MNSKRSASSNRRILAASIAVLVSGMIPGNAATLTWDTQPGTVGAGDGTVTGGFGTWDLTSGIWTADAGVTNAAWVNGTPPDVAAFGGAAGTVTLASPITANGLVFNTAGYVIAGGTLTLSGASPTITANANATITGTIAGTAGLTKAGTGLLALQSANSYSGGTTLSAGTLVINHPQAIGAGPLTIGGGTINTTERGISLGNNNPQNWNGNFTFTGTQNLNLGTGAVTLNTTPTVTVSANTLTVGGVISGNFGITKAGTGTLALGGVNTYTGPTTVAGTVAVSTLGNSGAAGNLGTNSTIGLGLAGTLGTLVYTGAGETTDRVLNWSGTTGGGQVINNGSSLLRFTSNTTSTGSGAKGLFFSGTGDGQIDGTINNSGGLMNLTKNGSGNWLLGGNLTLGAGNITVNAGMLTLSGTNVTTGIYNVNPGGRLNLAGGSTNTAVIDVKAGGMVGGAGLTSAVLRMANNSVFMLNVGSPGTSMQTNGVEFAGISTIGFDTAPSNGNYQVLNYGSAASPNLSALVGARGGFSLDTTDPNNQKIIANVTVANRTWKGPSATWDAGLSTAWTEGDQLFFSGDSVTFNEPADFSNVDLTGALAPASVTVNNTTNSYTFGGTGAIIGLSALTKTGTGSLTITQANFYAGGTLLRSGKLFGQNNTAFGTGPITIGDAQTAASAAELRLLDSVDIANPITVSGTGTGLAVIGTSGEGLTTNATTISGLVTLNRPTTFDSTVTDRLAFTGQITGNVGTLTLSGGGRTTFGSIASDFVGDIVVTGSGTILQASAATASETIPNTSNVTVQAGAFFQLASNNSGPETINALNGNGVIRTFPTSAFGSTVVVGAAGGTGNFSGELINGFTPLSFTKTGGGTQTISGQNNTYTGITSVSGGTLLVSGSISGTSQLNLTAGSLQLGVANAINDAAVVNLGGGELATGGFSEGTPTSAGLGELRVTGNSIIDFGPGNSSQLLFAGVGVHSPGATLSIENWSGTPLVAGTTGDRLMFVGDDAARLAFLSAFSQRDISFNGIGGYAAVQYDPGHFEIVAIPEPSTGAILAGFGLLRFAGLRLRRKSGSR